ncbi:thioredoxin [Candidatus Woesebacteria bacterium]|nr:thioredoxin [Candidatus Woesebacteria bacterium]
MAAQHLTNADFDEVLKSAGDKPVLVDFFAEWCGPCKMIAPVIEELATEYEGKAVITKVDVDAEGPLAQRFGVMSIPTLLIFKNGQPVEKQIGFVPKTKLVELITKNL